MKWHPDGKQGVLAAFAKPSESKYVIWDTVSGKITDLLTAQGGCAVGDFSPDASRIAWGWGPLHVIDLATRKEVSTLDRIETLNCVWSPRGDRLAAPLGNGSVKIWSAETGAESLSILAQLPVDAEVAWNPDGSLLASGHNPRHPASDLGSQSLLSSRDNQWTVSVWDVAPTRTVFSMGDRAALSVAFSPDGKRLLAGARHGLLKVYDVESGKETLSVQQPSQTWLGCVAWSPDGKRFAAPLESQLVVYDAATGKPVLGPI